MAGTGAPLGNKRAAKGKEWFDALRKEAVQRESLAKIAKIVLEKAEAGEQWAVAEVANRFDGKPHQSVDTTIANPDGSNFTGIVVNPVRPA